MFSSGVDMVAKPNVMLARGRCHKADDISDIDFDLIVSEEELWEEIIVANFFCIKLQSVFPPTLFIKPNR